MLSSWLLTCLFFHDVYAAVTREGDYLIYAQGYKVMRVPARADFDGFGQQIVYVPGTCKNLFYFWCTQLCVCVHMYMHVSICVLFA